MMPFTLLALLRQTPKMPLPLAPTAVIAASYVRRSVAFARSNVALYLAPCAREYREKSGGEAKTLREVRKAYALLFRRRTPLSAKETPVKIVKVSADRYLVQCSGSFTVSNRIGTKTSWRETSQDTWEKRLNYWSLIERRVVRDAGIFAAEQDARSATRPNPRPRSR